MPNRPMAKRPIANRRRIKFLLAVVLALFGLHARPPQMLAKQLEVVEVEGQPLGANVKRLIAAFDFLGAPLPDDTMKKLNAAIDRRDAVALQRLLDPRVLVQVSLNPEVRVKVTRGPGAAVIQQHGYTPHLVKIVNRSTVTRQMRVDSPQNGPVYSGPALGILRR